MIPTIFYDLDNTLCSCGVYYQDCIASFTKYQRDRTEVNEELLNEFVNVIDLVGVKLIGGFGRHRFPGAMKATSLALDILLGRGLDLAAAEESWKIGDAVFDAPYELYPGVTEVLFSFMRGGWQLVLDTKGDEEAQRRKVIINALNRFFPDDRIFIGLVKSEDRLREIVKKVGADVQRSWYVGDSVRDDIQIASAVGLRTVQVGESSWRQYDDGVEVKPTAIVESAAHLLSVIHSSPLRDTSFEVPAV